MRRIEAAGLAVRAPQLRGERSRRCSRAVRAAAAAAGLRWDRNVVSLTRRPFVSKPRASSSIRPAAGSSPIFAAGVTLTHLTRPGWTSSQSAWVRHGPRVHVGEGGGVEGEAHRRTLRGVRGPPGTGERHVARVLHLDRRHLRPGQGASAQPHEQRARERRVERSDRGERECDRARRHEEPALTGRPHQRPAAFRGRARVRRPRGST